MLLLSPLRREMDEGGIMRLAVILLTIMLEGPIISPPITTGIASQYARGVMQEVISYRISRDSIPANLTRYDGFIAVPYARDIGKEYWIRPVGSTEWELFLAVDCGGVADGGREWMLRNGILVEVDWATARRWDTVGRAIEIEMREKQ